MMNFEAVNFPQQAAAEEAKITIKKPKEDSVVVWGDDDDIDEIGEEDPKIQARIDEQYKDLLGEDAPMDVSYEEKYDMVVHELFGNACENEICDKFGLPDDLTEYELFGTDDENDVAHRSWLPNEVSEYELFGTDEENETGDKFELEGRTSEAGEKYDSKEGEERLAIEDIGNRHPREHDHPDRREPADEDGAGQTGGNKGSGEPRVPRGRRIYIRTKPAVSTKWTNDPSAEKDGAFLALVAKATELKTTVKPKIITAPSDRTLIEYCCSPTSLLGALRGVRLRDHPADGHG